MSITRRSGAINSRLLIVLGVFVALILLGIGAVYGQRYRVRVMAERVLADGKAAFEQGDYKEASKLLGRYLAKYPDDSGVLTQFAEANLAVRPLEPGNVGSAIRAYRRLLLVYSTSEPPVDDATLRAVYHKLARLYEQTGQFGELSFIARDRRSAVPDEIEPTLWLAKALLAQRKHDEARSELEGLVRKLEEEDERPPEYIEACNVLAVIAMQAPSFNEKKIALDWLARALEHDPSSVETLVRRVSVCRELARITSGDEQEGFQDAAQRDLESADQFEPLSPLQHLMLAESWMTAGDFDRAETHLKATASADPAVVNEEFVNPDDWETARFIVVATFAGETGGVADGVKLADEILLTLQSPGHRMQVLRYAIPLYVAAERLAEARQHLDELLEGMKLAEPTPAQNEQAKHLEAFVALAEGRAYEAVKLLEPLAAAGRLAPRIQRLLAEGYIRAGQSERAISTLKDYLRNEPADFAMLVNLVQEYVKQRAWVEALKEARRGEQMRPDDLELKLLRIRAQLNLLADLPASEREALRAELAALREAHPQRDEIPVYLARLAAQDGDSEAAEAQLKRLIEGSDSSLLAARELARLYVNNGDTEEAIEVYRQACERHPSDGGVWFTFGRLLTATGDHDEARDVLQRGSETVADVDDKRRLQRELGVVEALYGDRMAGIARLKRLAAEQADDLEVRDTLLNLPNVLEDREDASALIDEIRSVEGETGLLWRLHRARLLLSSPEWRLSENATQQREIMELLRFCVEASPSWQAPVLVLGRMYEILGRLPETERLYSAAMERGSATVAVAERLLSLYARQGRFDEARALLDRVRRAASLDRWSDHSISLAIQAGELSTAIAEVELRLSGGDAQAEDLVTMASLIYLDRQDTVKAFEYLDRARVLAPNSLDWVATQLFILREEDRLDEAKQLIDEFADHRNDFDSHLLRATFYRSIDDGGQATDAFARLPELSPDSDGYAMLGEYHARAGRLSDAIAVWEQGLEEYPADITLRRGIAKALIMRLSPGDRERAKSVLLELRRDLPDDGDIMWVLAELKLGESTEQSVEEAVDLLLNAIDLSPYRVEPYLRVLPLLLDRGEFDRAENLTVRARAIHPRDVQLLLAHAMVKLAAEDVTKARDLAKQALEIQPNSFQAVATLAEIAVRTGEFNLLRDIRESIAQAVEQRPDSTRLQVSYAIALVIDGQHDVALTLAPEIIVMAADILVGSGQAAVQEHAQNLYEHVINSTPQNAAAHFGLATLAYGRGDMETAIDGYRRALEHEPSNIDILNNLAWTLAKAQSADKNALEEALRHASEAVRLAPQNANLRDTRGLILSKLGALQEARTEYEKCVELTEPGTPTRAKALLKLGRTCARLDDEPEAHRCLQKALEIDRQHDVFTPRERGEISELAGQTNAD